MATRLWPRTGVRDYRSSSVAGVCGWVGSHSHSGTIPVSWGAKRRGSLRGRRCACADERADDASAQDEQRDRGGGEDGELPVLGEGERERDGGADDRADGGRAGAVQEAANARVGPQPVEALGADDDESE